MFRILKRVVAFVICLVSCYFLAALAGAVVPMGGGNRDQAPEVEVLLISGPIHYDFLLPLTEETRADFAFVEEAGLQISHVDAHWLMIGWGARDFYTSAGSYADIQARAVWRGVTGDGSVLRVQVFGALAPDLPLRRVPMGDAGYARFRQAILDSLEGGAAEAQVIDGAGLSYGDVFYAARERFHIFNTCNVWVGRMIRASGQRFGAWTPLPYSVTLALKRFVNN